MMVENLVSSPNYFTESEIISSVNAICAGNLVLLKGDIGYGFFGISDQAIRRMYEAKGRQYNNPCIIISNVSVLDDVARVPCSAIRTWIIDMMQWTTLAVVLPVNEESKFLSRLPPFVRQQTITNSSVALFLNVGPFLEKVITRLYSAGHCLLGSSANLSSQGNVFSYGALPRSIMEAADFSLDHGECKYANIEKHATTILNFTNWTVKRYGVNHETLVRSFFELKAILTEGEFSENNF